MRSQFVFSEIWIGLRRNLTMTLALIVVVAISLSLLGTGLLFVKQVDRTRTYWQGKVEMSIYLCIKTSPEPQCQQNGPATDAERAQLHAQLVSMPQVQAVYYVSQQQAYSEFRQDFSNEPALVQDTQEGYIPDSFEVKLRNPEADYTIVASAVTGAAGVETVVDEMTILDKFYRLLDGARNAVVIIALILIVAAVLLVANTIRLSAFNRRRETAIMRLVGASNLYIQLPFLLEGMIAGLIGWAIAAALLVAVKSLMLDSLEQYFSFNVGLSAGDLIEVILFSMVVGVLLCGVTSFLTLRRYLRI
ncbi:MAG TPA: permease-like cell division protein FtsX [Streptosporangiaceae bacterium]|nr:permease-like cell division protein FtsX [Streptosporangiaceae bacterium]